MAEAARFSLADIGSADGELAALGHRIARIDGEVDDHLLELMEIGPDRPEVARLVEGELDILAEQPAEQDRQLGQHVAELQHLRPQGLLAREGKQLAHQARRPVRVLLDVHNVLKGGVGRTMVHQQEVGEADDRRQHIVEVMRDAAGELADGLHLLPLRDLHLERALLGGVDRVGDGRFVVAAGLLDMAEINLAAALAVAGKGDVDRLDQALMAERRVDCAPERRMAFRLDQAFQTDLAAFVGGLAEQPHEGGIGRGDEALIVDRGDGDGGGMEQARKSKLGGARLFSLARTAAQHQCMRQRAASARRAADDAGCAPAGRCRRP